MGSAIPAISEILPANRKLQGEPPVRPFRFGPHPQPRSRVSVVLFSIWRQRRIHRHDHAAIDRLYTEQHLAARRVPFIAKLFVDPPKTFKIATRRRALRIDGAAALPWPAMPAPYVDRLIELGHVGQLAAQGANSAGPWHCTLRHLSRLSCSVLHVIS